jgi:hypothetical protein
MRTLTLEERGRQIQAKLDAGTRVPARGEMMNSGLRRTRSKRELLAALQRIQRDDGCPVGLDAKF